MPNTPKEPPFKFSPDFADALSFTAQLHAGHRRKNSQVPYVAHLLGVSSIVIENDGSEDEAIAALLHDAIEDQAARVGGAEQLRARIVRRYGQNVMTIIDGCTDAETEPKPEWQARKSSFIERLKNASESVCLVVAADKLHNTRSILFDIRRKGAETAWEIFSQPLDKNLWYYRTITNILLEKLTKRGRDLALELDRVVQELEK